MMGKAKEKTLGSRQGYSGMTDEGDAGMHSHAEHGNESSPPPRPSPVKGEGVKGGRHAVVEVMEERHPLSINEKKRLAELEGVIHKNLKAVFEVGAALAEIHRGRLYRATHPTFEAYIKSIYDFGVRQAYNIMGGWQAREEVREILEAEFTSGKTDQQATPWAALVAGCGVNNCAHLPLPENEAQVRPLTMLATPEEKAEAWKDAYNAGVLKDGKVTAKHVTKAVNQIRNIGQAVKIQKARKAVSGDLRSAAFAEAAATFLDVVQHEVDRGFRETSKAVIASFCQSILELVEAS